MTLEIHYAALWGILYFILYKNYAGIQENVTSSSYLLCMIHYLHLFKARLRLCRWCWIFKTRCMLTFERKKDVKKWLEARSRKSKLKKSFCVKTCVWLVFKAPKFLLSKLSDNAEFLCLRVRIVSDINLSATLNVILSSENFFNYDYSLRIFPKSKHVII